MLSGLQETIRVLLCTAQQKVRVRVRVLVSLLLLIVGIMILTAGPLVPVPDTEARPGDILAMHAPLGREGRGHVGVVTGTQPLSFIGSQSRTGPAEVGPGLGNPGSYEASQEAIVSDHQFYRVCVPDKPTAARTGQPAGGGGGTVGPGGEWIFFEPVYWGPEGISYGPSQWIWWPEPQPRPMSVQ